MKLFLYILLSSALVFSVSCDEADSGSGCSFTLSGDQSGTVSGATMYASAGYLNFICGEADGLSIGYPQMSVVILESSFSGAGSYDLTDGSNLYIRVALDESTTYTSDNTSSNCTAEFTSSSKLTFSCDDIPEDGGGGSLSVSSGSWEMDSIE